MTELNIVPLWNDEVISKPFNKIGKDMASGVAVYNTRINKVISHNNPNFELIPNQVIVDKIMKEFPNATINHYIRPDGLKYNGRYRIGDFQNVDDCGLELICENAYIDNCQRYLLMQLVKLQCSNGMIMSLPGGKEKIPLSMEFLETGNFDLLFDKSKQMYQQILNMKETSATVDTLEKIQSKMEGSWIEGIYEELIDRTLNEMTENTNLYDLYMIATNIVSSNPNTNWRTKYRQTKALSFFGNLQQPLAA